MKPSKHSIKWYLSAYLGFFVVILLGVLWLFQVVFLEDFYKMIKVQEIRSTGDRIAKSISANELEEMMALLAQKKELNIVLTTESGQMIYSVFHMKNSAPKPFTPDIYAYLAKQAEKKDEKMIYYFDYRKNSDMTQNSYRDLSQKPNNRDNQVVYTQILENSNHEKSLLVITGNIHPVDATVSTLRIELIYITCILMVLALGLAFYMARKMSAPIIEVNKAAKTLGSHTQPIQFSGKGYKEIEELADTLEYASQELAKTEQLRRELIANVSHDLRTPLTLIAGYAEVMRDLPGENTPENTQIIIDETNRLTSLVNDLLDLSKLEAGTMTIQKNEFNLTTHIEEMLKRYTALIDQQGYNLCFEKDQEVMVYGDELKISQVIYNLVNNAVNYTGEDKRVIIRQIVKKDKVRVEVTDTGDGIAKEDLPYIWERYYKVDKMHKRAAIGTGLGLSIVKNILKMHHEQYGVSSKVGEGSTFWFEIARVKGTY